MQPPSLVRMFGHFTRLHKASQRLHGGFVEASRRLDRLHKNFTSFTKTWKFHGDFTDFDMALI